MADLLLTRIFEHPRGIWTFQAPKMRAFVESRLHGQVLNLFGGITRLNAPDGGRIFHNDMNPEYLRDGDLCRDACDLTQWLDFEDAIDTVIFDPPFSAHQAVVSYGIKKAQKVTHAREVADFVLRGNGRVISLGFNSTGMNASRGYVKDELMLVNHGASHNDTVILVEHRDVWHD